MLNANGDPARFAAYGLPVVADTVADFAGPLAGILAGLEWAAANRPRPWLLSIAAQPFFPRDLVARFSTLRRAKRRTRLCRQRRASRTRCSGCGSVALRGTRATRAGRRGRAQDRPLDRALPARHRRLAGQPLDPFFNANTMDDIAEAERLAALDGDLWPQGSNPPDYPKI